jgi:hypothetical protein
MRRSHSYSKRELLDSCPRQFFYEYYAAAKKLPFESIDRLQQKDRLSQDATADFVEVH